MALKVKLSSGMREIDTQIHKPVVFINGVKKVLDKGITFVNGEKRYLWGKEGVPVDYIKTDGVGTGNVYMIGDDYMHTSYNGNVLKFDISNLDVPVVDQTVAWGTVVQYSSYQSTGGVVFGTSLGNVLEVNYETGAVSVRGNYPVASGTNFVGITNNYSCSYKTRHTLPSLGNIFYGNDWYWNGSLKYSTGTSNNPLLFNNTPVIQVDDDVVITNLTSTNVGQGGLYELTPSAATRLGGLMNDLIMLDGEYLCGVENFSGSTASVFNLYDKATRALVRSYTHTDVDKKLLFLGRIGENYYFVSIPKDSTATGGASVLLLDMGTLSVVHTQDLESDPFNENSGVISFWYDCVCVPQVSKTGFLAANTWAGTSFRCARIGELL